MEGLIEMLRGRKTFIIAIVTVVLGLLQAFGIFVIPEWIWPIIGGLGLTALRSGVNKVSDEVKPK